MKLPVFTCYNLYQFLFIQAVCKLNNIYWSSSCNAQSIKRTYNADYDEQNRQMQNWKFFPILLCVLYRENQKGPILSHATTAEVKANECECYDVDSCTIGHVESIIREAAAKQLSKVVVNGYTAKADKDCFVFGCAKVSFKLIETIYVIMSSHYGYSDCKQLTEVRIGAGVFTRDDITRLHMWCCHQHETAIK